MTYDIFYETDKYDMNIYDYAINMLCFVVT